MTNKDPAAICENCEHFLQKEGECRKYAPRGGEGKPWPSVPPKGWCNEFEGKPPERAKGKAYAG